MECRCGNSQNAPVPIPPHVPALRLAPFLPVATRSLRPFGCPAELVLVPGRKARGNTADAARPAFRRSLAPRIVAQEALWRGDGLIVTPNRYPFGRGQQLLWPAAGGREPDADLWLAANEWADATAGTVLHNTVGAAASIARAHVHLLAERLPFLAGFAEAPVHSDLIDVPLGAALVKKVAPICLLGVRGSPAARAAGLTALAEARLTAAGNVVVQDGTAWVFPRREETPAPHFPQALGAAEVWGRWCYVDERDFAAATASDLEQALVRAGTPVID